MEKRGTVLAVPLHLRLTNGNFALDRNLVARYLHIILQINPRISQDKETDSHVLGSLTPAAEGREKRCSEDLHSGLCSCLFAV